MISEYLFQWLSEAQDSAGLIDSWGQGRASTLENCEEDNLGDFFYYSLKCTIVLEGEKAPLSSPAPSLMSSSF